MLTSVLGAVEVTSLIMDPPDFMILIIFGTLIAYGRNLWLGRLER